jgi:hypothetical protein
MRGSTGRIDRTAPSSPVQPPVVIDVPRPGDFGGQPRLQFVSRGNGLAVPQTIGEPPHRIRPVVLTGFLRVRD